MPFFSATFDLAVIAGGGFCNLLADKRDIISELLRVLRPGGKLIFSAFHENSIETRAKVYEASGFKIKLDNTGTFSSFDRKTGDLLASSESFSIASVSALFPNWTTPAQVIWSNGIAHIYQSQK
jgi:ubiquinone/menaquinone biosynthesis C-methylase UbiE